MADRRYKEMVKSERLKRQATGVYSFGERWGLLLAGSIVIVCSLMGYTGGADVAAGATLMLIVGVILAVFGWLKGVSIGKKIAEIQANAAKDKTVIYVVEQKAKAPVVCPHCGAPTGDSETCEYCGLKLY